MTVSPILPQSTQPHTSSPPTDKPWRETPLIESEKLSKAAGCRILLKLDSLQPSGSFKIRGLGHFILKTYLNSPHPESLHFFSSSGGNAGLAAVHAANFVKRPCTVVVPLSTKKHMIEKLQKAGAQSVVQYGASWKEADSYMRDVVMKKCAEEKGEEVVGVHPFDDGVVWEGHSTLISEIGRQMQTKEDGKKEVPDWIICSVGGGGLFSGIMEGIQKQGEAWKEKTKVLVVETQGADSLNQSLEKGEHITLDGITSMATSLGATKVCSRAFNLATSGLQNSTVHSIVLSDAEAAMGCWKLWDDEKILVEAACGVNTALCYGGRLERALGRKPRKDEIVVIEVCGGSNTSREIIEEWRREFGEGFV
ncbi:hypothetical protein CKM354_001219400 [Cercospora kikuchii]|uniref:L-serine ammonia-lyase n=1 Tax=Cercospora kikuchii TaxID=84275 RepID=A0A9P3FLI2_9PEZI|nr:uncharacterized protein CKM354_001219400 [Cercospora kikuchii]GIZ49158.1 hypothetical protein CKM354_001219400 [Cercospora kikuchii]